MAETPPEFQAKDATLACTYTCVTEKAERGEEGQYTSRAAAQDNLFSVVPI